jgi:methylated-DNA-[protein]-cysteine S-methyltransferase
MTYTTYYETPLGRLLLGSDGDGLTGAWFEGQKHFGATLDGARTQCPDLPLFTTIRGWFDAYFTARDPPVEDLPLAPKGGAFRQAVWRLLCDIPYGEVVTYGEIARHLPRASARAVGGAVGHNPISIIIPCHRVIGANGSLTGYAGGVERKRKLLGLEGADLSRMTMPKRGTAV